MIRDPQVSETTVLLEEVAQAALARDALRARALAQSFLKQHPRLDAVPSPATTSADVLVTAAALIELFSQRAGQPPPSWTQVVGRLEQPRYLVQSALHMERLRKLCETESPPPLKSRGLLVPPDYMTFA